MEYSNEARKRLSMIFQQHAKEARNNYVNHSMTMKDENQEMKNRRNPQSYWSCLHPELSSVTTVLQAREQAKRGEHRHGNTVGITAMNALMKQTENEMQTAVNDFRKMKTGNDMLHNRKSESFRRVIPIDIWQSESTTKPYLNNIKKKEFIDFNSKNDFQNGQDQKLEKQFDKVILGEKNYYGEISLGQNASSSAKRKRSESNLLKLYQKYGFRTISTFEPLEREELLREASHIYDGATFQSFDEFGKYFEAYKIVGNYPYRVASSEVLRDGEGKVIERFKYKYIVFHCAHYGSPRKRGGGKRPNQSYLPLGCKARFRLNADTTNGCLRISSFHKEHVNHENNEEDYLRVVNKKRRNLIGSSEPKIMKSGKMDEIEKLISAYSNREINMPNVNKDVNASGIAENPLFAISSLENSALENSSRKNSGFTKISSPSNFISSQQKSAFASVTSSQPTEMSSEQDDAMQQILQQNIPLIDSLLQQPQLSKPLQCIEYLIMNAYIIKCGQYLPQEIYLPFICAVYGADYHLSEWSDVQLKNVLILLSKPPQILLQNDLPDNISINEIKEVQIPQIERAISAIRAEKLKRCDKIITRFITDIFNAISQPDFLEAVREFQKFADDINTGNIESYGLNMLRC